MNGYKVILNELKWIKKEMRTQSKGISDMNKRLLEGDKDITHIQTNQVWFKRFIIALYGVCGSLLILLLKLTGKM